MTRTTARRARLGAQAALEFALILPVAVTLLAFAVDVTSVWNAKSRIDAAAAEGARLVSADPAIPPAELAESVRRSTGIGPDARVTVRREPADPKTVLMRSAGRTQRAEYEREAATVTVSGDAPTFLPMTAAALGAGPGGRVPLEGSCTTIVSELGAS